MPAYTMLGSAKRARWAARALVGKDPLASTAGPNWLTYVGVPDLAVALATAEGSGGRVVHPITSIPDGGRYAVITDPQGGVIGLYEPAGDMGGSSGAAAAGPVAWHELTADDPEAALEFYKADCSVGKWWPPGAHGRRCRHVLPVRHRHDAVGRRLQARPNTCRRPGRDGWCT
jgi:predicted enzyme related to lactoylglutathione lyase